MKLSWTFLIFAVILVVLQESSSESCSKPTKRCKKQDGVCISKSETCTGGETKKGKKWCKDGKNCQCCIGGEQDCGAGEQPACSVLGGFCMDKDDECIGQEVFSEYFCSGPSCKCCFSQQACASCEEKEGTECGGDVFDLSYGGICRNNCDENEIRFGDCGPNCGCCVSLDTPAEYCEDELEQPCGGSIFGIEYDGICKTNCDEDEIRGGPCGNSNVISRKGVSRVDESCGCCVKMDFANHSGLPLKRGI